MAVERSPLRRRGQVVSLDGRGTTRACLSCHDSAADFAHVQLQTYDPGGGAPAIESCEP